MTTTAVRLCVILFAASLFVGCSETKPSVAKQGADGKAATASAHFASAPGTVLNYRITGMHCGGCAESIQETVAKLDGVNACEVSFEAKSAIVKVNDESLAPAILKAITDMKYTAERVEG
jgi:copper chaperone CopZ